MLGHLEHVDQRRHDEDAAPQPISPDTTPVTIPITIARIVIRRLCPESVDVDCLRSSARTINGQAYPDADPIEIDERERIRVRMVNQSSLLYEPLGHQSMKMTMRCAHLSPAFLSAEVSLLDPPPPPGPEKGKAPPSAIDPPRKSSTAK